MEGRNAVEEEIAHGLPVLLSDFTLVHYYSQLNQSTLSFIFCISGVLCLRVRARLLPLFFLF